jgi:ATPase subunit of ABC transporter with duplicated ATPase domains
VLQVNAVSKAYGDALILDEISFVVNLGDRVGLVGPNSSGKTTLLRIIVGQEEPDRGSIRISPADLSIGYPAQSLGFVAGATVGEVMQQAVKDLGSSEQQLRTLTQRMSSSQGAELMRLMDE